MRPKIKESILPYVVHDGKIHIGFNDQSITIEDEDGKIDLFLKQMNGAYTLEELASITNTSIDDAVDALDMLNEYGLVEDNDSLNLLNEEETARYKSNLNFFTNFSSLEESKYSFQQKLKDSKVVLLGIGGSNLVASCLAGMGIGHLVVLDFDTVETSNLTRQFLFTEDDVGRYKTEVARERLLKINGNMKIDIYNREVTGIDSLIDILQGADLVIAMIDSPTILTSRWVNSVCYHYGIPFVQGRLGPMRMFLQKFHPGNGACFDCSIIESLRIDPMYEERLRMWYNREFRPNNPSFAPNVSVLCGMIASEVANTLLGVMKPLEQGTTVTFFPGNYESFQMHAWQRVKECPTCGGRSDKNRLEEPVDIEEIITIAKQGMTVL
ncbi:HesA/MoeB/ThiF family protein [Brevibacillus daliensis]|uniref:HesA/MoeB/ThiF family protein n=1 Tax=Brevibacillus daliensis TaxID=2892995 RepID=UPI001E5B0418|nr:ThiF family adenylyltransferase [Brevibacillus daliensis]